MFEHVVYQILLEIAWQINFHTPTIDPEFPPSPLDSHGLFPACREEGHLIVASAHASALLSRTERGQIASSRGCHQLATCRFAWQLVWKLVWNS